MAETPLPNGQPDSVGQSDAVAPDSVTAEIMRRHAAKERLTPQEYGKLGAFRSRLARLGQKLVGNPSPGVPGPQPASGPVPLAPGGPALGGADPAETQGDGLADIGIDENLVRNTTSGILSALDETAQAMITAAAYEAGADEGTALKLEKAVALRPGQKSIMVETSPAAVAAMGVDPKKFAVGAFLSAFSTYGITVLSAVAQLRRARAEMLKPAPGPAKSQDRPAPAEAPGPAPAAERVPSGLVTRA
jgi:hypothetical protein